jgi:anti-sigma factor (TIGR02949 family)
VSTLDRMTCEEVFRRLNDYLDRELDADEMARVRGHLETCAICASEYDFEMQVIEQIREKLRRIDLPQSVIDKVRAALTPPRSDSTG